MAYFSFRALRGFVIAAVAVWAAASASAQSITVTDDFVESEISWRNTNGGYVFRWDVVNSSGQIFICGAGQFQGHSSQRITRARMRDLFFTLNGRKILTNITYFNEVPQGRPIIGSEAACKGTGVATPEGRYSISLDAPNKRYRD